MLLFHCKRCHHEWLWTEEGEKPKCDWCGGDSMILSVERPVSIEDMCEIIKKLERKDDRTKV